MRSTVCLLAALLFAFNALAQHGVNWSSVQKEPLIHIAFHPQTSGDKDGLKDLFVGELVKITNLNIKPFVPKSYADVAQALKNGQTDFAFLSGFSYLSSKKARDLTVLLKTIFDGEDSYRSAIIVKKTSKFKRIEDLKGKTIAFADEQSTSGYILPFATMLQRGIKAKSFFKKMVFSGHHKKSLDMLLAGEVDAVATWARRNGSGGAWDIFLSKEQQEQILPVFYTEDVPNEVFCVTTDFYKKHKRETMKIVAALFSYVNKPEERNLIDQLFRMDYFVPAYASDFNRIQDLAAYIDHAQ